jgi:carbamoyl-phosphate synthase large subunit
MGYTIFATEDTARVLKENGIYAVRLYKVHETDQEPNIIHCLQEGNIHMVINIPTPTTEEEKFKEILEDEYKIRRMAVDYNIPVLINLQLAEAVINAIEKARKRKEMSIKSLNDYHSELKEIYW